MYACVEGGMKVGSTVPRARLEPTSLAFRCGNKSQTPENRKSPLYFNCWRIDRCQGPLTKKEKKSVSLCLALNFYVELFTCCAFEFCRV